MKTNKFEEILRRKLEGIQPDFQDQEWEKWQAFRHHHTPSFWQSYGNWIGYAVAAATTAVMAVLYVQQSSQNEALRQEMEGLRKQMEIRNDSAYTKEAPGQESRTTQPIRDTVYVIERQTVYREVPRLEAEPSEEHNQAALPRTEEKRFTEGGEVPGQSGREVPAAREADSGADSRVATQKEAPAPENDAPSATPKAAGEKQPAENRLVNREPAGENDRPNTIPARTEVSSGEAPPGAAPTRMTPSGGKTMSSAVPQPSTLSPSGLSSRIDWGELTELSRTQEFSNSRNYLYRRLQARIPRRATGQVPTPVVAQAEPEKNRKASTPKTRTEKPEQEGAPLAPSSSSQKAEAISRDESLLPKFGLGLPYRVGVGQAWIGNTRAFTIGSEFLVGRHWAIQAGLRWHKLPEQRFYNEKLFRDSMREDFRKEHAKKLPPSFEIVNITTQTTLLQIPLGITYRGEMGNNFTYLLGTGTHLNVQARQRLVYDFRLPTKDYGQQSAERYVPVPMVNNVLFSAGIEKRWSPIVVQAGSFVESRLKSFPFLKDRTQVGFQVKLLYELGRAKKN